MKDPLKGARNFLINSQLPGMGWGYTPGSSQAFPEPTCYGLLALAQTSFVPDDPLTWLADLVQEDGQLFLVGDSIPNWATSLLIITLTHLDKLFDVREASLNWLIRWKGQTQEDNPVGQTDLTLDGWPWISDTFNRVQPTSLGVLAMKLCGMEKHERVKVGEAFLLDRMCLGGGWNYGLPTVLGAVVPPGAVDTAIALCGLQNVPLAAEAIDKSLIVLENLTLERPSAYALSLSILCMDLFDRPTSKLVQLLLERQESDGSWRKSVLWTSLASLALQVEGGGKNVFKI